ncbi:hypothetical protein JD504_02265 [Aeromonas hydrophila]|uniref:DUF488 domain-containing protein n=1 Tax=Aeromonas hydrophila TaxID=644 RepID=UPI00191E58E5|nr:hypothetical protein [Aeromonas hydrophila]MBL0669584.1 hypothetical protein [Aeromonas hydrophila]
MALAIVRLGTPRLPDEGLRIGTVRRPPRGVPKTEFARHDLALLAALSHTTNLSVGCYCEQESRCHRAILREQLTAAGAAMRTE